MGRGGVRSPPVAHEAPHVPSPGPNAPEDPKARKALSPHVWVSSTYFAEGYPYAIVINLAEILFKQLGASLQAIGLTSLFHLPWNLKFLWGPLLDRYETKRRWLVVVELALTAILVLLALAVGAGVGLELLSVMFLAMAVFAATNDIAIDGYYMEGLDEKGQSKFVGYRALAYKASNLLVRGPLLILTGIVGWSLGLMAMAGVMALIAGFHLVLLPRAETRRESARRMLEGLLRPRILTLGLVVAGLIALERSQGVGAAAWGATVGQVAILAKISVPGWIALLLLTILLGTLALLPRIKRRIEGSDSYYAQAFVTFLDQEHVGRMLAFVLLFRVGESFLQKMRWPMLSDVAGMTLEEYGVASGTVGLVASFAATFLGGWLIGKHGLRRWIWPFVIAQNSLNLLYVPVALAPQSFDTAMLTGLIALEEFGAGLGTAVFMVYLMRCCDPNHKAAHFAILSALMSVGFTVAGVASGFLAEAIGFAGYYLFTFAATLPMMALIWFIPRLEEREPQTGTP